jgi:outer membrane protein TolC
MMMTQRLAATFALCCCLAAQTTQTPEVRVDRPSGLILTRPYRDGFVPPIQLRNSDRTARLIRAGVLYLTLEDAIALAIENNLDLEVDRYGPLSAYWQLERTKGGGPLRGITGGTSVVNQTTPGQGVTGSELSAGLVSNTGGSGGGGTGNAIVSQIGPITPNLDPVLQSSVGFSHQTSPQPEPLISETASLVSVSHVYENAVQQGLISGGYVQATFNSEYLYQNAPTDILNPSTAPIAGLYARHNFLNSFGTAVNSRFIHVAQINLKASQEIFRSQLLNLVARVQNLYWDLVTTNAEVKSREQTFNDSQKFYTDTKQEIEIGVLARVELFPAEAEMNTRRRELAIAQATARQQANSLKDALIRDGARDTLWDAAEVVTLDHIEVPAEDNLPPVRQLVAKTLGTRPDVKLDQFSEESAKISALGTANGLLPQLQGIGAISAVGLAGTLVPEAGAPPLPSSVIGGFGKAVGQIARNDNQNRRAAVLLDGPIGNHLAQGDYGIEQLQLRQNEMIHSRTLNQIAVDISNQAIAIRQARARYAAAAESRLLEEQLLKLEQQKFQLGVSTINDVIDIERALAGARDAEVAALGNYSRARVALDLALGTTLENNHVTVADGLAGIAPKPQMTTPAR